MLHGHLLWSFVFLWLSSLVSSQSTQMPGNVPLAVRSPYINVWNQANISTHNWPGQWSGNIAGWAGFIRVDGVTYEWLGSAGLNVTVLNSVKVTPTQTIFNYTAGTAVQLIVTFLSPIEPSDPVMQSLPFSYLAVDVTSIDGRAHEIQLYCDISAEWVSGINTETVQWDINKGDQSAYFQVQLSTTQQFVEKNNQIEDVTVFFATPSTPGIVMREGLDRDNRPAFQNGQLVTSTEPGSAPISPDFIVFSLATDLGTIQKTSSPMVWAIGVTRDPVVSFQTSTGLIQKRNPLYLTRYSTVQDAMNAFVSDYANAKNRADTLDAKIMKDASAISPEYVSLASLAARQVFGATELTIGNGTDGKFNMTDVKMFMKDIGSPTNNGGSRVNPVEIIYASFPFFLYVNATYAGYLLSPILEFQDSSSYTLPYAARDLGPSYPIANGPNPSTHGQGIEQSGNMLIMALAHARISGDGSLISKHYNLLKRWADYLVSFNGTSNLQPNADLEAQANVTNLAIKGIIGIKAMSAISGALHETDDENHYAGIASAFYDTWHSLALAPDGHVLAEFGDTSDSWSMAYNLYADKLLQTSLIDDQVFSSQEALLKGRVSQPSPSGFGLPIDSIQTQQANAAWTAFTAAFVSDQSLKSTLMLPIWNHCLLTSGPPVPEIYKLDSSGDAVQGQASAALGGLFAPLALNLQNTTISIPPGDSGGGGDGIGPDPVKKQSVVGPVVGGVVGGLGFLLLLGLMVFFWRRRSRARVDENRAVDLDPVIGATTPYEYTDTRYETYIPGQPMSEIPSTPLLKSDGMGSMSTGEVNTLESKTHPQLHGPATVSSSASRTAYSSPPTSSQAPPSDVVSPSTQLSSTDVVGLRQEVEQLRRVMQGIQFQQAEAPPSYDDGEGRGS